jgi:hypothetical protein
MLQIGDNGEPTNHAGRQERARTQLRSAGLAACAAAAVMLAGCGGSRAPSVASVTTTTSFSAAASTNTAGGAADSGTASSQTQQQDSLKYARCMRANGVPNFPDPSADGGFTFNPAAGVDPSSPAFKAAQAKCEKVMPRPGGGLAPGTQTHPSAQWLATMVKAALCVRRHGVPNFPDPTTTVPSLTVLGGGRGQISNIDGVVFVFPAATIDTLSPAFIRAAKTCGFPLHNH